MKKLSLLLALVLCLSFVLAGCGGSSSSSAAPAADSAGAAASEAGGEEAGGEDGVYKIGYSNRLDSDEFLKTLRDAFESTAGADSSLEVVFADANNDSQKQLEQIDNFFVQGVDCMILCPNDEEAIVPGIEQANEKGIPVICFSTSAAGGEFYQVGISNYDCGMAQGEYASEHLPEGAKVLYLGGNSGFSISRDRKQGFLDGIAGRDDIEVLSEMECMYTRDEGMQITEDWIQAFPEFDAIVAVNDLSGLGAIQALKGANRLDGVMVLGIDAIDDALLAVEAGEMAMTVKQDAEGQVDALYETVKTLQEGGTPEKENMVPLIPVTPDNVGDFL